MSLSQHEILDILKQGRYYFPANKHYNFQGTVNCDRCYKQNIVASIGYLDYDLCLDCARNCEEVLERERSVGPPPEIMTLMMQDRYRPMTRMLQRQYRPRTKMIQRKFRKPYADDDDNFN